MYFISNQGITDPRVNLALEEYCLRHLDPDNEYLLLYINEPSIIIGRFQNTLEEINQEYVTTKGIHVVRRVSGGGAVYHDHGNLNFSFMTRYTKDNMLNFKKFTEPVIRTLQAMGLPAELTGRNDIVVWGKKISGNAQYATRTSMLSHGTLLFDSEIEILVRALNVKDDKIRSKALKSVRSRVTNILECLERPMDMDGFRRYLLENIFASQGGIREYELSPEQWEGVHALSREKYCNWDWNYGKSPTFNVQRLERFAIGQIDTRIDVDRGMMRSVRIYGDFLGYGDVKELEERLIGREYRKEDVQQALEGVDLSRYFGPMKMARFIAYLIGS